MLNSLLVRAGFDAVKDVISPIYEAVPRHRIRGLYEDFHSISERVLLLRGEVHNGRKPVSINVVLWSLASH